MLGSWLSERILRRSDHAGVGLLLLLKAALGLGLIAFSFARGTFAFIGVYLALYLLIGGSGVVENTLLNRLAPSSHRASILSLFSLVLQLGGLVASAGGYFVSKYANYANMWQLAGVLLLAFCVVTFFFRKSRNQSENGH